jgi:fermentation-respiration switch protein FrsA (DUF1100 family)
MTKMVVGLLGIAAALYVAVVGLLFVKQRAMIYPGAQRAVDRSPIPGFTEAMLRTADGLELRALHAPARKGLPTLVFFHGNGDNLGGAVAATRMLGAAGYGLLLPEYRGYGGNPGAPSEAGLYADGEAALAWLGQHAVPVQQTVLLGNSLGSGVATELAMRHQVAGLVLISGFTSLADVAAAQIRFAPVRLLLRDHYENAAKMPKLGTPVLVLHGADDTLISVSHATELAGLARHGTLITMLGVGHELAYLPPAQAAILRWLEARRAGNYQGEHGQS